MRRMKLLRLVTAFSQTPWALKADTFEAARAILHAAANGERANLEPLAGPPPKSPSGNSPGVIAVIPIWGVIANRAYMVEDICGPSGTSTERLQQSIQSALANPDVKAIVLDIDSPGGSVFGVQELADFIFSARETKPILANANSLAASAAYWIGTAASEFTVTPSGMAGSVGVYAAHMDASKAEEIMGLKTTLISAGKYKVEGHPYAPLDTEAAQSMQKSVDEYYSAFTASVAKYRGTGVAAVRDGFGEGRTVSAKEAAACNMSDGIATLDETIQRAVKLARQAERNATAPRRSVASAQIRIASAL